MKGPIRENRPSPIESDLSRDTAQSPWALPVTTDAVIDSGTISGHVAVMQLLEELRAEHDLIDRMLDSLRTAVSQFVNAQGGPQDLIRFVRFFRVFADQFHHSREEQVLFATLVNQLHLPGDHGPIAVLTDDHRQFKTWLDQIEQLIVRQPLSPADQIQLGTTTERYITAMQHHIDAENSVLFVEGEICLQDAGISELPARSLTADEQQVRLVAEDLLQHYPPTPNVEVIRGDGCVMCPAYQNTCDGYEREWPTVSRWGHAEDNDPFPTDDPSGQGFLRDLTAGILDQQRLHGRGLSELRQVDLNRRH